MVRSIEVELVPLLWYIQTYNDFDIQYILNSDGNIMGKFIRLRHDTVYYSVLSDKSNTSCTDISNCYINIPKDEYNVIKDIKDVLNKHKATISIEHKESRSQYSSDDYIISISFDYSDYNISGAIPPNKIELVDYITYK